MRNLFTGKFQLSFILTILIVLIFGNPVKSQIGDLLWEENFDNLNNWIISTGNGSWGWGNGELQFYQEDNVQISSIPNEDANNALHIVARQESGANIVDQWGNPLSYTSGKINSMSKISVQYGMIETRLMVPDLETGGWPAFWLLGLSNFNWPTKGELDMMEMGHKQEFRDARDSFNGGDGLDTSGVNQMVGANAIFYSDAAVNPDNPSGAASLAWDAEYARPYFNMTNPLNNRFLTYRMYWDSTAIRFTVIDNEIEYDLYTSPFALSEESDEFQNPFYFIINLAIGGTLTDAYNLGDTGSGTPVSMPLPADMYVDYIKVYSWNGQGDVNVGPPIAKDESFGLFTDNTQTESQLVLDDEAFIYVWEGTLSDGSIAPYEGENGISWQTTGQGWFGAGFMSAQPINLSNFENGYLKFRIKIPANVNFQIGITDAWSNQNYLQFPANTTKYGLVRDGEWGQAAIPVSELRGSLIDLRMLAYEFVILEVNGASCEFALDDIYYDGGSSTAIDLNGVNYNQPTDYVLYNNYPNPFNPKTVIRYQLAENSNVELSVFNLVGQKIATLVSEDQTAGIHQAQWDAANFASGIYLYKLQTGSGFSQTKRMLLVK